MNTTEAQAAIAAAVAERGYRRNYTAAQFGARNIAKLGEEFAELADLFRLPRELSAIICIAGVACRSDFANRGIWDGTGPNGDPEAIKKEMADCAVVLLNMAAAYEECYGESFDVVAAAVAKATADVVRGMR